MAQIFISYRRSDSQANTDRIYARLVEAYGWDAIFKDVDDIPAGVDFPTYLDSQIRQARVVLVMIGREWATSTNDAGRPRLSDPNDFVRLEVELALAMEHMFVIPVLVNNATMPESRRLSRSVRPITRLNAVNVRNDPDFNTDIERLIRQLNQLGLTDVRKLKRGYGFAALAAFVLTILMGVLIFGSNFFGADVSTPSPQAMTTTDVVTPTPTTGQQALETVWAEQTELSLTEQAFYQTATLERVNNLTATAQQLAFSASETAAVNTIVFLSVTPTNTPDLPTATDTPNIETLDAPTSTRRPSDTPTPLATQGVTLTVVNFDGINLRSGPGTNYPVSSVAARGRVYTVIARTNEISPWYLVSHNGRRLWVLGSVVQVTGNRNIVPIAVTVPPVP